MQLEIWKIIACFFEIDMVYALPCMQKDPWKIARESPCKRTVLMAVEKISMQLLITSVNLLVSLVRSLSYHICNRYTRKLIIFGFIYRN